MIYLDNNATTFMPKEVIAAMLKWMNKGNPSSSYRAAVASRDMMSAFKKYIYNMCGMNPAEWEIIFNSCSTEGNSFIISAVVNSYFLYKKSPNNLLLNRPHIIATEIEHKSILLTLDQLKKYRDIEYTLLRPNQLGFITVDSVKAAIKPNTCLITVMAANNETGGIMDIVGISKIAHDHGIPFHTDAAQYFGKYLISFNNKKVIPADIDSFCVSFHKLHGPPGSGFIAIKKEFIKLYDLGPQICGTQNDGLRGGTENIPAVAGSMAALEYTLKERSLKNKFLLECKITVMKLMAEIGLPCISFEEYLKRQNSKINSLPAIEIVFISGINIDRWLPNTLLISVVKNSPSKPEMCNTEIKNRLAEKGIILSIGSACNTASKYASHVLYAINADDKIKKGALRISFGDYTDKKDKKKKIDELKIFIKEFAIILKDYNN